MTATKPTPIADSIPQPSTGPVETFEDQVTDDVPQTQDDWQPDVAALQSAKGDPTVWAHQIAELVGHTTGKWIDDGIFIEWLGLYATQVAATIYREALFKIANTPLETHISGDPSLAILAFRDQLAQSFRKPAGL